MKREEEKKLIDEITSLYYFNFCFEMETIKRFSYPMKFYNKIKNNNEAVHPSLSPKRNLEKLVKLDKDEEPSIGKYFKDRISDLCLLSKDIDQALANY